MRKSGILLHPTSLPGSGPCGDLGPNARQFVHWLAEAGQSLWQTLPLHPVDSGFSPYSSSSAFAGGTHMISLDDLKSRGLLSDTEIGPRPTSRQALPAETALWKEPRINLAAKRLIDVDPTGIKEFIKTHRWVKDWALYATLKKEHGGRGWQAFEKNLREREPKALQKARRTRKEQIQLEISRQKIFFDQWAALRKYAAKYGIEMVGDMPIFISGDSCETWTQRNLFRWGENWQPNPVTGAPPDAFTEMGQCWGSPHYNWPAHTKQKFKWWIDRLNGELELTDWVRIDHFRGFCAAWEIPQEANGDARLGNWGPAPGEALFRTVKNKLGKLPFIAEDLGHITPDVDALRDSLNLKGMHILQFAFSDFKHKYLPHNHPHPQYACYTGTHDNNTAIGWYNQADPLTQHRYRVYVGRSGEEPNWDLIRLAWSSVSDWSIAQLQDVLGIDERGRMNMPGTIDGNWTWRAHALPLANAKRLREITEIYGRLAN